VTEPAPELPARFGSFYLFDLIGSGGMAEIFLSKTFTSLGTERLCVIKRILPQLNADASFCEMLIHEAKLCSHLSHANAVQTFDLGQFDGQYYIAMEYVEGFDLNQLLGLLARAKLALPLQFALYILVEALRGLHYAHRLTAPDGKPLGIIHRDVSPTNVLISTDGDVKLCDFGIAKAALGDMDRRHLDEYHLKGKFAYMAPEHVAGEEIDRRADLFAAGILLWELLSGRRLYKTKDEDETLRRAREAEIQPLVDRGFPEFARLEAIVTKALDRNPEDRFQSGQEFIDALEDYMHAAGLIVSQLKLAEFLRDNFGEDLERQRRERERNLAASIERLSEPEPKRESSPGIDEAQRRREADITASLLLPDIDEDEGRTSTIPPDAPPRVITQEEPEEPEPRAEELPEEPSVAPPAPSGEQPQRSPGLVAAWIVLVAAIATAIGLIYFVD
jgi:serine/threonine-protein kinase